MAGTILKQNTAETGLADGTTATVANSDDGTAGDAFNAVTVGASNTITCSTASPWADTRSWRFVKASVNQCHVDWTWTGAQSDFVARIGFRFPAANLAAEEQLIRMFATNAYGTQVAAVALENASGRRVRVYNNVGATNAFSLAGLALATDYVAQIRHANGGDITVEVYPKGSTTATAAVELVASANSVNSVWIGPSTSNNSASTYILDDLAVGHSDWLARTDIANTPPNAGPDQTVEPYTVVTLAATDAEQTPAWSQTGGSPTVTLGGSGATRTFTAPAIRAGTTLTFTASDGTLTDSMSVVVYPQNEFAVVGGVEVPFQLVQQ